VRLLVFGSLAYDRIMNFEGRFADHILPEKIHLINVCFTVNGLMEKLGGTAGNIAYGLAQLKERPSVLGCLGKDGGRYVAYLERYGVDTSCIRMVDEEFTAGAFITTDRDNNQITGFNPGAMNHTCGCTMDGIDPNDSLAVIAPGGLDDMCGLPGLFRKNQLPFIFDPGQQLNVLTGQRLLEALSGASILISNDYELEMITRSTGQSPEGLLERVDCIITTKGEEAPWLWKKTVEPIISQRRRLTGWWTPPGRATPTAAA
jgi:adenosine kinase